jgi:hypothetical protein
MEQIKIGSWVIEIDVNKTKEFYEKCHLITEDCSCDFCANFVLACDTFSQEVKDIFNTLGIDPRKEGEVYECKQNEDGTHLYSGFYHTKLWEPTTKDSEVYSPSFVKHSGIEIGFSEDLALVPGDFPMPVFQFEFQMNVPWLL